MKVIREFCDVCRQELSEPRDKYGLCITIGYSVGGWGHRQNLIDWKGEVCRACYQALGPPTNDDWRSRFTAQRIGWDPPNPPAEARVVRPLFEGSSVLGACWQNGGAMKPRKILFLDIDGVLNSRAWVERRPDIPYDGTRRWEAEQKLDPDAIEEVNRIVSATGCAVVLDLAHAVANFGRRVDAASSRVRSFAAWRDARFARLSTRRRNQHVAFALRNASANRDSR